MHFGLEDHQEHLVATARQWVDQRWARADLESVDERCRLWLELEANGWPTMLGLGADAASVLDAVVTVEALARGGCSLALVPAMVSTLIGTGTSTDSNVTSEGLSRPLLVIDGTSPAEPVARGLEVAQEILVARSTTEASPGSERSWQIAIVGAEEKAVEVVQDENPLLLCGISESARSGAEWRDADPEIVEKAWRIGAVLSAAELVGVAQSVVDMCASYAKDRIQGGKPIGAHQAIQHRLADMLGYVERCRYLCYAAAQVVEDGATTEVHQAKALAARDCLTTIRSGHQVLGAIGFSAEHGLPHLHKQALVAAHEFGSASWHWAALETD